MAHGEGLAGQHAVSHNGLEQLLKTVMADGVLPRKTFSMGHAQDKRYYIEARRIVK